MNFRFLLPRPLNLQNLEYELRAVEAELDLLAAMSGEGRVVHVTPPSREDGTPPSRDDETPPSREDETPPSRDALVLQECREFLSQAKRAFDRRFPDELLLWQLLHLMRQRLLLIVPFDQLPAKWVTLRSRLSRLDKDEAGKFADESLIRSISDRLARGRPLFGEAALDLRSDMAEIRKHVDERAVLEHWNALALRRKSIAFLVMSIVLGGLLVAHICHFQTVCPSAGGAPCAEPHSVYAMILAGGLGALLSGLSTGWRPDLPRLPPLAQVSVVRPVIGGIAGLFVYFIADAGFIDIRYPALYAVAIAFGFSERAFFGLLGRIAGETEARIGRLSV